MKDGTHAGFYRRSELLRSGAELSYTLDSQSLGQGIIDLCRTARREIICISKQPQQDRISTDSFEGRLLYGLMPEIARRLIEPSGAQLLLMKCEIKHDAIKKLTKAQLRHAVGLCMENGNFEIIAEKVRDRFDPEYHHKNTFFANEAIGCDIRAGNILEVALSRVSPPQVILSELDIIATKFRNWFNSMDIEREKNTWAPHLPQYDQHQNTVARLQSEVEGMEFH